MTSPYDSHPGAPGVTRVGPPELTPPGAESAAIPKQADTAYRVEGGNVREMGTGRSAPSAPAGDLAESAKANGGRVGSHLKGSDRVIYRGFEATVDGLVASGLWAKDAEGYIATDFIPQAKPATDPQQQQQAEEPAGVAFADAELEEIAGALATETSPGTQAALIAEYATKGDVSDATIARIAEESGASRDQAKAAVSQIIDGLREQAGEALSRYGDPAAIAAWAQANAAADYTATVRSHASTRSPAVWDRIGAKFMAVGLPSTAEGRATILNGNLGGWTAKEARGGTIVVSHPQKTGGREVTWRHAIESGLMKTPTMGGRR